MKIALTTLFDEQLAEVGELCVQGLREYTKSRPSCELHVFRKPFRSDRPFSWQKLDAIQAVLNDYEWVMWVDADCLLVNTAVEISTLIETYGKDVDLITARDFNGICCAVMLVRNSNWTREFISTVQFLGDVSDNSAFGADSKAKWEQNTIKVVFEHFPALRNRMNALPTYLIADVVEGYSDQTFMFHFGGIENTERAVRMREMSAKLGAHEGSAQLRRLYPNTLRLTPHERYLHWKAVREQDV